MSVLQQLRESRAAESARQAEAQRQESINGALNDVVALIEQLRSKVDAISKKMVTEVPETDLTPVLDAIKKYSDVIVALASRKIEMPKPVDLTPILEEIRSMELSVTIPEERLVEKFDIKRDARGLLTEVKVVYA